MNGDICVGVAEVVVVTMCTGTSTTLDPGSLSGQESIDTDFLLKLGESLMPTLICRRGDCCLSLPACESEILIQYYKYIRTFWKTLPKKPSYPISKIVFFHLFQSFYNIFPRRIDILSQPCIKYPVFTHLQISLALLPNLLQLVHL